MRFYRLDWIGEGKQTTYFTWHIVIAGKGKPGSEEIANANWIRRKAVKDEISVQMLARYIDRGEAEVLILGKEIETDWLVIDDDKARDAASAANFKVIGLVG